jgi:hypothetical protein
MTAWISLDTLDLRTKRRIEKQRKSLYTYLQRALQNRFPYAAHAPPQKQESEHIMQSQAINGDVFIFFRIT